METAFAKIITDLNGRSHIMLEGEIVSLYGPTERVNEIVRAIVCGLRSAGNESSGIRGYAIETPQPVASEARLGDAPLAMEQVA